MLRALMRVGLLLSFLVLPSQTMATATSAPWQADPRTRIVRVRSAGIVHLSWDALADSGWDLLNISAQRVQLWRQGQQLPMQVTASGITFRVEPSDSQYTMEAAYWLGIGETDGLRTVLSSASAPLTWEPDMIYQSVAPTLRGDRWFAGELRTGGAMLDIPLTLPQALPTGSAITIALTAIEPHPTHQFTIYAGTTTLAAVTWSEPNARTPRQLMLTTQVALPAGSTSLRMSLTTSHPDLVLIDSLTIPAAQMPLSTLVPMLERPRMAPPVTKADQLIISHPDFIPALAPLVAYKEQLGQQITVADVLAIYDTYSWGERDPEAIRVYLQQFGATERPGSVLLVGAGTARMRIRPGEDDPTRIPPYLLATDPVYGEIACDTCYVRLGSISSTIPDLPIGRLPARTIAEAEVMVAKTLLALHPVPGAWQQRALVVADNDRDSAGVADSAGPFAPLVVQIAAHLPGMQAEPLIYTPDQGGSRYQTAPALRNRLFPAWDAGVGLVAYIGHASPWQWAFTGPQEPVPYLLTRGDAVRTNRGKLPILLSLTCLSGSFQNPTLTTIDEDLLRQPDGGVAASFSPTGSGVNTGHAMLMAGMLPALMQGETVGAAHLAGLQQLLASGTDLDLAAAYGILGDPDLRLPAQVHARWSVSLPLIITNTP